jgi:hypothetical protein
MEQRGLLVRRPKRPRSFPITSFTFPQLHAEGEPLTSIKSWQAGKMSESFTTGSLLVGEVSWSVYSIHLAAFEWEFSPEHEGVCIQPGQAAVLDLSPFSDTPEYAQVARAPVCRTWRYLKRYISLTHSFESTIRQKQGVLISDALILNFSSFNISAKIENGCVDGRESSPLRTGIRAANPAVTRASVGSARDGRNSFHGDAWCRTQEGEAADVVLDLPTCFHVCTCALSDLCSRRTYTQTIGGLRAELPAPQLSFL